MCPRAQPAAVLVSGPRSGPRWGRANEAFTAAVLDNDGGRENVNNIPENHPADRRQRSVMFDLRRKTTLDFLVAPAGNTLIPANESLWVRL